MDGTLRQRIGGRAWGGLRGPAARLVYASGAMSVTAAPCSSRPWGWLAALACFLGATACAAPPVDPMRYRLAGSGDHWDRVGDDAVVADLVPRYPDYFEVVLDPERTDEPPVAALRAHLEGRPVDRRNYDALNAVAIGYYEINWRGELARSQGSTEFISAGFRAAHLAAIPWRAYSEIDEPSLRDAILDFFADVGRGEKLGSARTRGRLAEIVADLERFEADPARRERIGTLTEVLAAPAPEGEVRRDEIVIEGWEGEDAYHAEGADPPQTDGADATQTEGAEAGNGASE